MSRGRALPSVVVVDVLTAMYADAWSKLSPQVLEVVVRDGRDDTDEERMTG
jgi:hypothetical protein